ncbi:MAG: EamA family transporter [Rhodoferax sp.]|nr:EamA family transporter [Rhodoferax sp.]MDP3651636.1 EamA family transporter [Rhodoferax sp.]
MQAHLFALAAIVLWASLAALGISLQHVPPFLLTGIALVTGSVLAWPAALRKPRLWKLAPATLALGVFTLFGFHFFLFMGLRLAPAVQVNLVNYLWPLLMVVLAPWYLPGSRLRGVHVLAAGIGFAGAALAILGRNSAVDSSASSTAGGVALGYLLALASAFIWANYSLQTKRLALAGTGFPTAALGLFGLLSGALSLLCHGLLEAPVQLSPTDWALLAALGVGPLGGAFYLWDAALKRGDARHIGLLSFLTPLLSTLALLWVRQETPSSAVLLATLMIVGAALLGSRAKD